LSVIRVVNVMEKGLAPLANVVGIIGAIVIGFMMLLTVIDVIGRHLFNAPLIGSMDLTMFMMVIVVFFSIAHCEFGKGHITIDLVVSKLPRRVQAIINSIMYSLFLLLFAWVSYQFYLRAFEVLGNNIVSATLEIPVAPFYFVAFFGCILLTLLVLMNLLSFMAEALKK
jgi:TRAP-type transport system small permease protein